MPSYQEWVRKIDINIDYYSAFIKSWIAFNSWYRSEYTERTDRGNIKKKKLTSVPFSPRHLFRAPRHIGIFSAPLSPYLPLAAAFRIISPFCCKKNRDFADLTLDKRDSADYLFKRLQFFAGLYYV